MSGKRAEREGWSCLEEGVVCTASSQAVAELLQVRDAVEVNKRCSHHQDMEYLMGLELRERQQESERERERKISSTRD